MEYVPTLELGTSADKITEQLKRTGQLVFTDDDRPVAIVLGVDGSTLEDTLVDLRRLRAQRILKAAQESAFRNGTSDMTIEEINAEITAARAERKAGAGNG